MTGDFPDELPLALREVRTCPLFVMRLNVRPLQIVGQTPGVNRRVGVVPGGTFSGARLSGDVLDGGNDWQSVRGDGSTALDVRLVLRTVDDALIGMTYRGVRHGPHDVMARLDKGKAVDPIAYYFRIAPLFETASGKYKWLNNILAAGTGHRLTDGPVYSIFEVL
jgi:Protein of unknown function (DUF3237)